MVIEEYETYITVNGAKILVDQELRKPLLNMDSLSDYKNPLAQFVDALSIPGLEDALGMPDMHAGNTFPIGTVAAVDISRENACICPEGVGGDINCGVKCLGTNLMFEDIEGQLENIADLLYAAIPVGFGGGSSLSIQKSVLSPLSNDKPFQWNLQALNGILDTGLQYLYEKGVIPYEDMIYTEDSGCLKGNSKIVPQKAKGKGLTQFGTLGSGNHYVEVQVVDEIFDEEKAAILGIQKGQVVVAIHTGSRGLGNVICDNFMAQYMRSTERNKESQDGVLEYIPYASEWGQKYYQLMCSGANYAYANRAFIGQKVRNVFKTIRKDCLINNIYDTGHNIAKLEKYKRGDQQKNLLVHRKGASRVLPPQHAELPPKYSEIGQPVLIGGSMGTCSYILVGAEGADSSYNSTCHGAGRLLRRGEANKKFTYEEVEANLKTQGIVFRCGSQKGLVEEAPMCYKDVNCVVKHSDRMGLTHRVARLIPKIVVKG